MTSDNGLARRRVRLPGLSPRAYEHPADRTAMVALRTVRGFDQTLRWLAGLMGDRKQRLMYLASSVRVDERQFPAVHQLVVEGAQILDLPDAPETFITQDPTPTAETLGLDTPFLVLSTGLVALLDEEELRFVVGHELGHVLSGHAVYRTMLVFLLRLSKRVFWLPVGYLGLRALLTGLEEWFRKSEVSCDRAGLLAGQDPAAALRAQMKMAGGSNLAVMDVAAFLDQAREYDATGDVREGIIKLLNLQGQVHPFAVSRAAELRKWVDSGDYQRILDGAYPRRDEEAESTVSEEAWAAARSYKRGVEESADSLMRLLRNVGEEAVSAGIRIAERMRGPSE
jgi:Zn-dependent protease with chaperone function